uniref:Putative Type IV pilus assembly protein PilB Type II secretion system protein E n=1 Tax=Magnetococcus massalia (strain MO-1) TaxID=451514 RepID=A0A1S7LMM0_MAGMO|nr:putative Type IV pilus assembly protein PilB; Type II secretion system protein E [Candidatus Magnetococcus massalia]
MAKKGQVMLGEVLIEKKIVTKDQLSIALIEQKKLNQPLGKTLVQLGFVTEGIIRDLLGETLGQESVDLSSVVVDSEAVKLVSKDFAKSNGLLPISYDKEANKLTVAMSNTFNVVALDNIRSILGEDVDIQVLLAGESELQSGINQFFGFDLSLDGIIRELETGEVDEQSVSNYSDEYSQPLVRLVDVLLADAVKQGASDIHFEPDENIFRVRYRIDGVLRQLRGLHKKYHPPITVRLKVMSGLNIAENRAPQDGHFSLQLMGRPVDFRVSSMNTIHGENVVLRILDRQKGIIPLEELGLAQELLDTVKLMTLRPEGIILVTGPTGSGKTTTLYSMIDAVNTESVNIMTLEDPVEYPMSQIRQSGVNEEAKMGFADGIRAMMRQDPDIILVGEIRDPDTAEMAFRAAMTGHQVFSTVHANSAVKSITRLLDIGVTHDILAGNLIGLIGQRLVRKLCSTCREAYTPNEIEKRLLGLTMSDEIQIYRPGRCAYCNYQGYRGRTIIMEALKIDSEIDDLIANKAHYREILNQARSKGFYSMADDGARAVLEGQTSITEVSRVVDLTERLS